MQLSHFNQTYFQLCKKERERSLLKLPKQSLFKVIEFPLPSVLSLLPCLWLLVLKNLPELESVLKIKENKVMFSVILSYLVFSAILYIILYTTICKISKVRHPWREFFRLAAGEGGGEERRGGRRMQGKGRW